ncbi:MAG: hypothetical protein KA217_11405, partial [Gammaproteobacteria bacterium]|nr:hypothetical protein [Gammaproteobacteria bacterium]
GHAALLSARIRARSMIPNTRSINSLPINSPYDPSTQMRGSLRGFPTGRARHSVGLFDDFGDLDVLPDDGQPVRR